MGTEYPYELDNDPNLWLDEIDLLEIESLTPEEAARLEAMVENDLRHPDLEADLAAEEAEESGKEGDEHLAQGLVEEAINAYRRMIQADPDSLEAHMRIADAYLLADMSFKAVRHYRRAARSHPGGRSRISGSERYTVAMVC